MSWPHDPLQNDNDDQSRQETMLLPNISRRGRSHNSSPGNTSADTRQGKQPEQRYALTPLGAAAPPQQPYPQRQPFGHTIFDEVEYDPSQFDTVELNALRIGADWTAINNISLIDTGRLWLPSVSADDITQLNTARLALDAAAGGAEPHDIASLDTDVLAAVTLLPSNSAILDTTVMPAINIARTASAAAGAFGKAIARGTTSLILREGLLKVVVLAANVVLARILAPQDFGIFAILGFFNTFLATFGTFGLGPSVVQRKQEPTVQEVATLFTFQVTIAATLVAIAWIAAPYLASIYHFGNEGLWLIRAMALSFLFISAAATPMTLLERKLSFGRVAIAEVCTGISYQVLAVLLALEGYGVWSLVVATLASTALGALVTYSISGWWPRLSFRFKLIWPLVSFGMKYQINSFAALVKDNLPQTFVAGVAGAAAVGYISWASTLAFYPLVLVSIIGRVTFPAYSRATHNRVLLQNMIEATIRTQSYFIFPAVAILAGLAPYITELVFAPKWLPAVPLLYLLLVNTVASTVSSALAAALNALGKPGTVSALMVMWLVLGWMFTIPLVLWLGFIGYGITSALLAATVVITIQVFKRHQAIRITRNVILPLLAAVASGLLALYLSHYLAPKSVLMLIGEALVVLIVFTLIEVAIDRRFISDIRFFLNSTFARVKRADGTAAKAAAAHDRVPDFY